MPALTTRTPAAVLAALTDVLTDKVGPDSRDEILRALDAKLGRRHHHPFPKTDCLPGQPGLCSIT